MPILNSCSYPYLTTWNWAGDPKNNPNKNTIEMRDNALVFHIRDFMKENYWYIEFLHGDAFKLYPINTLIPQGRLDAIREGKLVLALSNSHEGYHSIVEPIYEDIIKKFKIPPQQVLIITESADLYREVEHVANKNNLEPCRVELLLEFEHNAKWEIRNDQVKSNTLAIREYDKKFICLNGLWRTHRSALMSLMISSGLLEYGYVSYNSSDHAHPTGEDNYNFLCEFGKNNDKFLKIINDNKNAIIETNKLTADTIKKQERNSTYKMNNSLVEMTENSYFTVVTETNCCNETHSWFNSWGGYTGVGRILSEKTFKPIALQHPFIVVGVPRSLELLRDLGYKTFSPWINESYDTETDDIKRFMLINNEIKRLCMLKEKALEDFLINAKEICEYNYKVLLHKDIYSHTLPIARA